VFAIAKAPNPGTPDAQALLLRDDYEKYASAYPPVQYKRAGALATRARRLSLLNKTSTIRAMVAQRAKYHSKRDAAFACKYS
jgi:hypothetical protein